MADDMSERAPWPPEAPRPSDMAGESGASTVPLGRSAPHWEGTISSRPEPGRRAGWTEPMASGVDPGPAGGRDWREPVAGGEVIHERRRRGTALPLIVVASMFLGGAAGG